MKLCDMIALGVFSGSTEFAEEADPPRAENQSGCIFTAACSRPTGEGRFRAPPR